MRASWYSWTAAIQVALGLERTPEVDVHLKLLAIGRLGMKLGLGIEDARLIGAGCFAMILSDLRRSGRARIDRSRRGRAASAGEHERGSQHRDREPSG